MQHDFMSFFAPKTWLCFPRAIHLFILSSATICNAFHARSCTGLYLKPKSKPISNVIKKAFALLAAFNANQFFS